MIGSLGTSGGLPPLEQQALAQKASIPELIRALQDGTIDSYIGQPILQAKNKATTEAKALAMGRQKPPTVGEQNMATAEQLAQEPEIPEIPTPEGAADVQQGQDITALRSNLPGSYAGGGIIAFANQGEVELPEGGNYPEEEEEEELATPYDLEAEKRTLAKQQPGLTTKGLMDWATTPLGGARTKAPTEDYYKTTTPPPNRAVITPEAGSPGILQGIKDWAGGLATPSQFIQDFKQQFGGSVPEAKGDAQPPAATTTQSALANNSKISRGPTGGAGRAAPVIQAQPESALQQEVPPPSATQGTGIDALKDVQDKADTTREDLKKLILGSDDSDNKLNQRALLAMMEGGFKTAAGTSPYAITNIGAGGAEGVKSFAEGLAQIDADKRNKINQLVTQGLKGEELDMELKKLGITKDYYDMHKASLDAEAEKSRQMARYYGAEADMYPSVAGAKIQKALSGGAGPGTKPMKIPMAQRENILAQYADYDANPLSSPAITSITDPVQKKGYIDGINRGDPAVLQAVKNYNQQHLRKHIADLRSDWE